MCGIVGLFAKTPAIEADLGRHLAAMLVELSNRGPDSAGVAFYRNPQAAGALKVTLFAEDPAFDWSALGEVEVRGSHAVLVTDEPFDQLKARLPAGVRIMSAGSAIEIYKEKGLPAEVAARFRLDEVGATHALGHTRMATESAVTTEHSHPFSTGLDLCLVHNGSLSNHNRLREQLRRRGLAFQTDNDTEVAAGYLTWRLAEGDTLEQALQAAIRDLDGFYTFAVGTKDGFAVVRDPIACKHAVLAETDDWVAMATEYRAIAKLPGARDARIWEPAPAQIYKLEPGVIEVDLAATTRRALNQRLHDLAPGSSETDWTIRNPDGGHAIAVGLTAPVRVTVDGHVGFYCGGMNRAAEIVVSGHAGPGVAENMMSGVVRVRGNASQSAGASGRGGLLVIEGDTAARCGISMKGIDIVVAGSVGHMSAFMAQRGTLVVCGDAGHDLGDSIYEARLYVRGRAPSLGSDCIEKELRPEHVDELGALLAAARVDADPYDFRRYGSARRLYNFHVDHAAAY